MQWLVDSKNKSQLVRNKIYRNPNFWAVLMVMTLILFFYYSTGREIRYNPDWLWRFEVWEIHNSINGSLLYIPYICSILVSGWVGLIVIWLLSLGVILPYIIQFTFYPSAVIGNILFLTSPVLLVLLASIISSSIKREKRIYQEREAERQTYMAQIMKAHEDERKRIARELHDDTIQSLLALANRLQYDFEIHREDNSMLANAEQAPGLYVESIYSIVEEIRKMSMDLRPSILDDFGLLDALRWLVDKMEGNTLKTKLVIDGTIRKFSPETDVILFRFIQEALNNVKRHSKASQVTVFISFNEETVSVNIQDNGIGFDLPKAVTALSSKGKLGIIGMQERARLLRGIFNVSSKSGHGTSVSLQFEA